MENQPPEPEPELTPDLDHPYAEGLNNLLTGLSNVIEEERFVKAVSNWVDAHADDVKKKAFVQWRALTTSAAFSLAIFGGICVMAWNGKIPKEATSTLLGSLIGYWFGRSQTTKEH